MSLNGFFQCTAWPGVIGIMGNWFGKGRTGIIMGIWAINASLGNIFASLTCNILENSLHLSWTYNFFITALFAASIALSILLFLKDKP